MTKILRIKNIEYVFEIESGKIYNLVIENSQFLYEIISYLNIMDEDTVMIFDENQLKASKYLIFITDPLNFGINSKKQLSFLYNELERNDFDDNKKEKLSIINELSLELMNEIVMNSNQNIEFDNIFEIKNFLSLLNVKYKESKENYIEYLISFINIVKSSSDIKCFIIYNFLDLLSDEDVLILKKELEFNHISLINLGNKHRNNIENIIIDRDLCEFYS